MKISTKRLLTTSIGVALGMVSLNTIAQESDSLVLEEIIVTAQKREQSMMDVPISIAAISGAELNKFAIRDFDNLVEMIPGLSSDSPDNGSTNRAIGIRGVQTQNGTALGNENTVGFYIDNVPITIANPRLVDLERVEVLRGPQGTLYGASSLAGLLKYVPKKPQFDSIEGHVLGESNTVKWGGTGYDIEGAINIPLASNFAIRASAYYEDRAGYIDARPVDLLGFTVTGPDIKDFNSVERKGGRLAMYWEPTENFSAHLSFMMNERTSGSDIDNFAPELSEDGPVTLRRIPTNGDYDDTLTSLELEWDAGPVLLQSTTAFYEQSNNVIDLDGTNFFGLIATPMQISPIGFMQDREEFTQEIRVHSNWDSKFNYTVGLFWSDRDVDFLSTVPQQPGTTIFGFPNSPDGFAFWGLNIRAIEERALFGQLTYDFNDQWAVTAGGRFFKFDTALIDDFRGNPLLVRFGEFVLMEDSSVDDFVPKLNLSYRPNEDHTLYASAAEGFRAGGSIPQLPATPQCAAELEDRIGSPTVPSGYSPDSVWTYEIGLKSIFADGRVHQEVAVFRMDWTDIQIGVSPLCGLSGTTLNGGEAQSQGVEYQLNAAITDNLVIGFGFSYIDAEFTEDVTFGGSFIYADAGDALPNIPEWSGNIRASYTVPINDTMEGFIRGSLSYRDDRVTGVSTGAIQPAVKTSYHILNLFTGITLDHWTFTLYGENLTNERPSFAGLPLVDQISDIGGQNVDYSLRPRTYGFQVRYDFY